MSTDQSKALERIKQLLLRTEERGASEAEAATAAKMVCKLLIKFPGLLSDRPNVFTAELQQHERAAAATQRRPFNWDGATGFYGWDRGTGGNTAAAASEFVAGLQRPEGYVTVRYTKLLRMNSTEVRLLVETNNGYEELWLPTNKLKIKTRVIWIDEGIARERNLFIR